MPIVDTLNKISKWHDYQQFIILPDDTEMQKEIKFCYLA